MKRKQPSFLLASTILIALVIIAFAKVKPTVDKRILAYTVHAKSQNIQLYWLDNQGLPFQSILNLKSWLNSKHQNLLFATNGGMYTVVNIPKGLFVNKRSTVVPLDTTSGTGNFYLKPNGVFYITISKKLRCVKLRILEWAAIFYLQLNLALCWL